MPTSIGRVVLYTISDADAREVARQRTASRAHGNTVVPGAQFPATIVATGGGPVVNLSVQLDGQDTLWAPSRSHGDGPGTWTWPPRV